MPLSWTEMPSAQIHAEDIPLLDILVGTGTGREAHPMSTGSDSGMDRRHSLVALRERISRAISAGESTVTVNEAEVGAMEHLIIGLAQMSFLMPPGAMLDNWIQDLEQAKDLYYRLAFARPCTPDCDAG